MFMHAHCGSLAACIWLPILTQQTSRPNVKAAVWSHGLSVAQSLLVAASLHAQVSWATGSSAKTCAGEHEASVTSS